MPVHLEVEQDTRPGRGVGPPGPEGLPQGLAAQLRSQHRHQGAAAVPGVPPVEIPVPPARARPARVSRRLHVAVAGTVESHPQAHGQGPVPEPLEIPVHRGHLHRPLHPGIVKVEVRRIPAHVAGDHAAGLRGELEHPLDILTRLESSTGVAPVKIAQIHPGHLVTVEDQAPVAAQPVILEPGKGDVLPGPMEPGGRFLDPFPGPVLLIEPVLQVEVEIQAAEIQAADLPAVPEVVVRIRGRRQLQPERTVVRVVVEIAPEDAIVRRWLALQRRAHRFYPPLRVDHLDPAEARAEGHAVKHGSAIVQRAEKNLLGQARTAGRLEFEPGDGAGRQIAAGIQGRDLHRGQFVRRRCGRPQHQVARRPLVGDHIDLQGRAGHLCEGARSVNVDPHVHLHTQGHGEEGPPARAPAGSVVEAEAQGIALLQRGVPDQGRGHWKAVARIPAVDVEF